jgi:hypothetical protein
MPWIPLDALDEFRPKNCSVLPFLAFAVMNRNARWQRSGIAHGLKE